VPRTPGSFTTAVNGRAVSAHWLAPTSGTAPTRYTVEARLRNPDNSRTSLGLFPVATTNISSPVGPGRYELRVRSENICGNSGFTSWQTVTVE
jgi:hypothetical protein